MREKTPHCNNVIIVEWGSKYYWGVFEVSLIAKRSLSIVFALDP